MEITSNLEEKLLNPHAQKRLRDCSNVRNRFIFLLGREAGMRITEVCELRWAQVRFSENIIRSRTLKRKKRKTGEPAPRVFRDIPMKENLFAAAVAWFEKSGRPDDSEFCFPAIMADRNKNGHISRFTVHDAFQKIAGENYSFHDLRHTCLTELYNSGATLLTVSKIAGHSSTQPTEIYTHVTQNQIRAAFAKIDRKAWYLRIWERLFPTKEIYIVPAKSLRGNYRVGRRDETARLLANMEKRRNTYIKGTAGIGKTKLVEILNGENLLKIDEIKSPQKIVEALILYLKDIGKEIYDPEGEEKELKKVLAKGVETLAKFAIKLTEPQEITLLFDNLEEITPRGARLIETLSSHFHVVIVARFIPADRAQFIENYNFDVIELRPLSKPESLELIKKAAAELNLDERTPDISLLHSHVLNSTNGNPLFILEHLKTYGKEEFIPTRKISSITHSAAKTTSQMNVTSILFVCAVVFSLYRYIIRETDAEDKNFGMLVAGGAIAFALIIRFLMTIRKDYKAKTA
jgi:hypothetical protein